MTDPIAFIPAAPFLAPALAAGDEDFVKFIFMIIVGSIVGIGSLISAAKKKQSEQEERQRHRDNWERIEQEMRERAANATRALSQPPAPPQYGPPPPQYATPPPPPPLPQSAAPYPAAAPLRPQPVFAPTRSIEGPYVPPRPAPRRPAPPQRPAALPPKPARVAQPLNRPQAQRLKKQKRGGIPPAPPLAPATPAAAHEHAAVAPTRATSSAPREGSAASTADAAALSRWLTADTLRSQFILTEILQPPLALREPNDRQV